MRHLRLILALAFMVLVWTVLGLFSTAQSRTPPWLGMTIGVGIGVFFGLVSGGNRQWRIWDTLFGPEVPNAKDD